MVEQSTFLKHFKGATEEARKEAIRNAVKLALQGDLPALKFLFTNGGEGFLQQEPLVTFRILPYGTPCPKCGRAAPGPPL